VGTCVRASPASFSLANLFVLCDLDLFVLCDLVLLLQLSCAVLSQWYLMFHVVHIVEREGGLILLCT